MSSTWPLLLIDNHTFTMPKRRRWTRVNTYHDSPPTADQEYETLVQQDIACPYAPYGCTDVFQSTRACTAHRSRCSFRSHAQMVERHSNPDSRTRLPVFTFLIFRNSRNTSFYFFCFFEIQETPVFTFLFFQKPRNTSFYFQFFQKMEARLFLNTGSNPYWSVIK